MQPKRSESLLILLTLALLALALWGDAGAHATPLAVVDSPKITAAQADVQGDAAVITATLELVGHTNTVWGVTFSPDGKYVATGSIDRSARLWDPASGRLIRSYSCGCPVNQVSFSPDGRYLAGA